MRLAMVVPPSRDQLIPWLLEGRGDIIAASFTITEERGAHVAFSQPYLFVDEMVVSRAGDPPMTTLADLKGTTLHVRRSSSYYDTLERLQSDYGPFTIVEAPEDLETEQLIGMVARGEIPLTVSDSHILNVELTYRDEIVGRADALSRQRRREGDRLCRTPAEYRARSVPRWFREEDLSRPGIQPGEESLFRGQAPDRGCDNASDRRERRAVTLRRRHQEVLRKLRARLAADGGPGVFTRAASIRTRRAGSAR